MSKEIMESVIGKAVLEPDFRDALLANPDQTLAGFDLTLAEKIRLKRMDSETLEALARTLNLPAHEKVVKAGS